MPFSPLVKSFPTSVKIGPYTYTVHRCYERISKHRKDNSDIVARLNFHDLTIDVDPSVAPIFQAEKLLHEVLHGVWHLVDMGDGKLSEESIVNRMSPSLLAVLRDNPDLVACLTEA